MNLVVETDKRLNVYTIWDGKQIILCKNIQKGTLFNGNKWVGLWPSEADETKMLNRKKPTESTEFRTSNAGYDLLTTYQQEDRFNKYIASVEYHPCNGKSERLWKELEKAGEFKLWDIVFGPLKYFRKKNKCLITIYRVFEMYDDNNKPITISRNDIVLDKNSNLPNFYKKIKEEKTNIIFDNQHNFKPILNNDEFKVRKDRILQLIKETRNDQPYDYNSIGEYIQNKYDNEITDESNEIIYCIHCGAELPIKANYCNICGERVYRKRSGGNL